MDFHDQSLDRWQIRAGENFFFNAFDIADNHSGPYLIHHVLKGIGLNQNLS